jgi:Na+/H+-dicarboxylate symporter
LQQLPATNVVGNGIATTVVAKWEGKNVDAGDTTEALIAAPAV